MRMKTELLAEFAEVCYQVENEQLRKDYAYHILMYWRIHPDWPMSKVNRYFTLIQDVTEQKLREYHHGCFKFEDHFTVDRYLARNFPNTHRALCNNRPKLTTLNRFMKENKTHGSQLKTAPGFRCKKIYL